MSISPINSASAAFASSFAFADTVAGLAADTVAGLAAGAGAFADAVAGLAAGAGAFADAVAGLRTVVINLRVLRLLFEFELLERLEFELLERLELELLERLELELEFEFEFELLRFELRRVFTRAGAFAGDLATTAGLGAGA